MNIFNKKIIQALICAVIATALALTTHIYLSEWIKPTLDAMMQHSIAQGINPNLVPEHYPKIIFYAAYGTAFMIIGFLIYFYYHTQHLIPGKSRFTKVFLVTAIIFVIKGGDLIRQPIMDVILNYVVGLDKPILFVALNHIDKWLANLLLAICLVYLCPKKTARH